MSDINFEKDQEEVLDKTENIDKLAVKIKELQRVNQAIETLEESLKKTKKDLKLYHEKSFQR